MAFQIGQIRSNEQSQTNFISDDMATENTVTYGTVPAGDGSIPELEDRLVTFSENFSSENKYFVVLNINKLTTEQKIKAYLYFSDDDKVSKQYIGTYKIPAGTGDVQIDGYVRVEMVLAPNRNYPSILLELERTVNDDYSVIGQGTRIVNVSSTSIYTITNLLDSDSLLGGKTLKQIGVQAPAGLLMCINGEGIRVGPSGLYEIKEEYRFNFLGFVAGQTVTGIDGRNVFILDYLYE